jgi:hypothetical protein
MKERLSWLKSGWEAPAYALFAFLLSKAVILLSFPEHGWEIFQPVFWARWDSGLYFSIAEKGYEAFPCWTQFKEYPPGSPDLCGNCGWMPGFPMLLRALMYFGIPPLEGAMWIVNLLLPLWFGRVYSWIAPGNSAIRRGLFMALAACWPGSVYLHAAFPIVLYLVLSAGYIDNLLRGRYGRAAVWGCFAAIAYSTGFFLALLAGPLLLFRHWGQWKALFQSLIAPFAVLASFGIFLLVQWKMSGIPFAFFVTQSKYGHGINSPLKMLGILWERAQKAVSFDHAFPDYFAVGMTLLVLAALVYSVLMWRHQRKEEAIFSVSFLLLFWLVPMSMSPYLAFHRQSIAGANWMRMGSGLKTWALVALLCLSLAVAVYLNRLFMMNLLI